VPKTFLAGVSTELAKSCHQQPAKLNVSEDALRIFLAWLISRDLDEVTSCQTSLAQAWNFGELYDIPLFQDAVMHQLVPWLTEEKVGPRAVVEAYAVTERGTKLQRVFITQLARDMRSGGAYAWDRTIFTEHHLEEVPGFFLDLTDAMCETDGKASLVVSDYTFND
jgi:hypothetical protein